MSHAAKFITRLPPPVRRMLKMLPGSRRIQARLIGTPKGRDPKPGELRPVVYLPTWARWDEMRQRPQYLLAAFAQAGHDVYFIDPREPQARVADGVRIVPSLRSVPRSHVILYVHFAPVRSMFSSFVDATVVYDILDDLTIYDADEVGMPEERRVRSHHPEVVGDADVVLGSAPELVARHLAERSDIVLVENGVDPDRFRGDLPVPSVLQSVGRPMIGYHGAVARWFDFELLAAVVGRLPGYQFVFVGPVEADVRDRMRELGDLANVHVLGAVPSDEIARYVAAFDVGTIPFVVDELTRGVSPLKMYEYLAARVPVVATPLPVCVEHPVVATAATPDQFVTKLTAAVEDSEGAFDAAADAAADAASWGRRVDIVRRELEERHRLTVPS